MATRTVSPVPCSAQQFVPAPVPEYLLKTLLWHKCGGARYLGIQRALKPEDDLVLFQPPDRFRQTTLAIPLISFQLDLVVACVLVIDKIAQAEHRFDIAECLAHDIIRVQEVDFER
jgi:hypothetical protein